MSRNAFNRAAVSVLQAYLAKSGITYVPDELSSLVSNLRGNQPFDVCALVGGAPTLAFAVRSAKIKGYEKWSSTTHTYLSHEKLVEVEEWPKRQKVAFDPYILYVMEATCPKGPPVFTFNSRMYQLVAVPPAAFRAHMHQRAPTSWDKVQVPSRVFEQIAVPLGQLLANRLAA